MNDEDQAQLRGKVEIDGRDVWGGKPRRKFKDRKELAAFRESKATVLEMIERSGRVRLRVIESCRGEPLSRAVGTHVNPVAFHAHRRRAGLQTASPRVRLGDNQPLGRDLRRRRHAHEHDRGLLREPQDGDARGLQHVSDKYLQPYLDEFAWRHNHRHGG